MVSLGEKKIISLYIFLFSDNLKKIKVINHILKYAQMLKG